MKPDSEDLRLKALVDARLKALPPRKAPAGLARQVMARIEARSQAPWYQRSWWDWPIAVKVAFLILTVCLGGALSGGGFILPESVGRWSEWMPLVSQDSGGQDTLAQQLADTGWLLWDSVAEPWLLYLSAAAVALYLACIGLGTVCYRYALNRA